MKITWHSSACVTYESDGTKVLFDPWLESKAFLGSWSQWPPAQNARQNILETKFQYIVYTHFHSDHFDQKFLLMYLKAMNALNHKPVILIAENSWPQLSSSISNIAKDMAIIKVSESGQKISLNSKGFSLTLFCSDHCDPLKCGKSLPCFSNHPKFRSIDSVALIKNRHATIANFNDAVSSNLDLHLKEMGIQVDLVMGVFAAAGSFPQCQIDLTQTQINLAKVNFIDGALKRLVLLSERLKAKYIFPFAGQYILIGEKANLNENRAVIPVDQASLKLNSLTDKTIITLNTNESVELYLGEISSIGNNYVEPTKIIQNSFLHQYRDVEYFYEKRDTSKIDLKKLEVDLEVASNKLSNMMMNTIGQNLNYSISIRAKNSDFRWNLNFYENLKWGKHIMPLENYCEIYLDLRLLEGCVRRKHSFSGFTSMHWNQAHIGSHLLFKQNNYNATAHYLLNFLHT